MPLNFAFDFRNPDYTMVFKHRAQTLESIRKNPQCLPSLKHFYKQNPAQFIIDWGTTNDPRNVDRGLPASIPFILFPKQIELVEWVMARWKGRENGLFDKSRDMGASWISTALAGTLCMLYDGIIIGFGSRKKEYVDKVGDPKSLLYKVRRFVENVPVEFRGNWNEKKNAPSMRISFPDTGSIISGEAGDGIGRGDRASIYFVDEAAFLERPELIERSLSETTNCRIDMSTPNGTNNPFSRKRFEGKVNVFSLHWTSDPRKDQTWYQKKCDYYEGDPVVIAQELDLDYAASVEGILIPQLWVNATIDAHVKLGINPTGKRIGGYDIADKGADKCAFAGRYGALLERLEVWSGKDSDTFYSTEKVFNICAKDKFDEFNYDADGMGAGVRGDSRVLNERFQQELKKESPRAVYRPIKFNAFHGSGAIVNPNGDPFRNIDEKKQADKGRTNEDYFANFKAQSWWELRRRFLITYRAIVLHNPYNPDDIISISSSIKDLQKLKNELSQPTYVQNNAGKMLIDKMPEGARSPNRADAVMIAFAPIKDSRGFFS